ncbi:MAG TPA: hypothetical protein VGS22_09410 [Thermoanaerobaculia bacterium]|nr:hypothetical protein [Thermoanaerobaculia bacterium]
MSIAPRRSGQNSRKHGETALAPKESDLDLRGTIRAVLTWNLGKRAFLDSDGSRDRFRLLRGGKEFAAFIRDLQSRVSESDFFEFDPQGQEELELSYRSGLLTQYMIEYELLPTYRVKPGLMPTFTFDDETAQRLERAPVAPPGAREALERAGRRRLENAWSAWPTKRFRLSRYGLLQVILERKITNFQPSTQFLLPLTELFSSMGPHDLSVAAKKNGDLEEQFDLRKWETRPAIEIPVQWEIVGRILGWLISVVDSESENDHFRFDLNYGTTWREREAKLKDDSRSLPLRSRFFTLHLDGVRPGGEVASEGIDQLDDQIRLALARLLEGSPLVERAQEVRISPQRAESLRRVVERDEATWEGEVCFLSYDTAVIAGLESSTSRMIMKLDCDLPYVAYWPLIARTLEYLNELRLVARFSANESSDRLENMMKDIAATGHINGHSERAQSSGAIASLVARLRNASTPVTISQSDALLSKLERLKEIFGIETALDHAERNLSATQRLISHAESTLNERQILKLTVGLAAFTCSAHGIGFTSLLSLLTTGMVPSTP